jgi:hypothetical protein
MNVESKRMSLAPDFQFLEIAHQKKGIVAPEPAAIVRRIEWPNDRTQLRATS